MAEDCHVANVTYAGAAQSALCWGSDPNLLFQARANLADHDRYFAEMVADTKVERSWVVILIDDAPLVDGDPFAGDRLPQSGVHLRIGGSFAGQCLVPAGCEVKLDGFVDQIALR